MSDIVTQRLQDPMQSFQQAAQFGTSIRTMQAQAEAQVAAAKAAQDKAAADAEKQARLAELADKLRSGGATVQDYMGMSAFLDKDQAENIRQGFKMRDDAQNQATLRETGEVFSAFKAGRPEIAIGLLDEQIKAAENAGNKDEAQFLKTWRDVAKENPDAAEDFFGFSLAQIPGGDKVLESALKLTRGPGGETKAYTDIAYTEAQIEESKKRVDKIAAELKERELGGGLTVEDRTKGEDDLRKELATETKVYRGISDAYYRLSGVTGTGAGDLVTVFGFMKMIDPGSTVRESEQASAANAAGVPSAIRSAYNKIVGGGLLDEKARKEMMAEAKRISDKAAVQTKQAEAKILDIAKRRGLDLKNIVPPIQAEQKTVEVDY